MQKTLSSLDFSRTGQSNVESSPISKQRKSSGSLTTSKSTQIEATNPNQSRLIIASLESNMPAMNEVPSVSVVRYQEQRKLSTMPMKKKGRTFKDMILSMKNTKTDNQAVPEGTNPPKTCESLLEQLKSAQGMATDDGNVLDENSSTEKDVKLLEEKSPANKLAQQIETRKRERTSSREGQIITNPLKSFNIRPIKKSFFFIVCAVVIFFVQIGMLTGLVNIRQCPDVSLVPTALLFGCLLGMVSIGLFLMTCSPIPFNFSAYFVVQKMIRFSLFVFYFIGMYSIYLDRYFRFEANREPNCSTFVLGYAQLLLVMLTFGCILRFLYLLFQSFHSRQIDTCIVCRSRKLLKERNIF